MISNDEKLSRRKSEGWSRARIEALACYAHSAWAGWMIHLFKKCVINPDGTATIPKWAVDRYRMLMITPYEKLSEEEKEKDREEARVMLRTAALGKPVERIRAG